MLFTLILARAALSSNSPLSASCSRGGLTEAGRLGALVKGRPGAPAGLRQPSVSRFPAQCNELSQRDGD
ncbi:hypothetical protein EYF80_038161 [Liparis tanakae]|uniref:Uncharacterized protein n=1 Tax=Liparis tanakae TaxID=230148 RepID=A0A4Z2GEQ2_9TELE|nr:hypothetical protein EYF80_038161 [Liparis tanakae]